MRVKILKYSITLVVGISIAVTTALLLFYYKYDTADQSRAQILMRSFSDGFFVSGALVFGWGILTWLSGHGTFDIFSYSGRTVLGVFLPMTNIRPQKRYYDYKQEKAEKPKKQVIYLIASGGVLIFIAVIFMCIFYIV